MRVTMQLTKGPETGKTFEFDKPDSFLVGRSQKAHLRFDTKADRLISRTHFIIDIGPTICLITDLDSKNGTRVNGKRINQTKLKDGDEVAVGKTKIKINITKGDEKTPEHLLCAVCRKDVSEEVREQNSEKREFLVYTCRDCQKKAEKSQKQKMLIKGKTTVNHTCMECGSDLSDKADADEQVTKFEEALYLCPECTIKIQDLGLDFKTMEDYLFLNKIGEGEIGFVYKVVHQPTGRIFAMKRIRSDLVRDERSCKYFEREISIQSKVVHPNLVRLVDLGRAGITPFFITEYLDGGNIENLVTNVFKGPVEQRLACEIAIQILKGVKALHDKGFIHRDLKPSNYLLNHSVKKKNLLVKITDYGLAKSYEDAGNSIFDYSKTGKFAGSLIFIPPEQMINYRYVKPTVDLYAVGVSLYYMLCGRYTMNFPTPLDRLMQVSPKEKLKNPVESIIEDPPIPILKQKPDIPKLLAAIVDKAVKKEEDKRFQSADEFREAIEKAAQKKE